MAFPAIQRILIATLLCGLASAAQPQSPIHKCLINGSVTFQNALCPLDNPAPRPTKDELNAARKERLAAQPAPAAPALRSPPSTTAADPRPPATRSIPSPAVEPAYRCDGRQHCSQMRSCSEAKFFLANCPNVKMDGDQDGIPCEEQWCTGLLAR
jgi:hypothetical protein